MAYKWQSWLASGLRAEGCTVREYDGWENRGRPSSTGAYAPYAVGMHHTGTKASASDPHPTLHTIVYGRSDLPGPLAAVLIGYDGVIDLVAAGRTNHGGEAAATGPMPAGDANALYIGFEIDYDGNQPMSSAQHEAAVRAAAAVLRHFTRSVSYARQHREWSVTGKWDCGGWDANRMRDEIGAVLAGPPGGDDDMPLNADDKKWLDAQFDNMHAHLAEMIGSHDQQIKDRLNALAVDVNALQAQVDAL